MGRKNYMTRRSAQQRNYMAPKIGNNQTPPKNIMQTRQNQSTPTYLTVWEMILFAGAHILNAINVLKKHIPFRAESTPIAKFSMSNPAQTYYLWTNRDAQIQALNCSLKTYWMMWISNTSSNQISYHQNVLTFTYPHIN